MIICSCTQLTEGEVQAAIENGAKTYGDVFRACGKRPQCGGCQLTINLMLKLKADSEKKSPT